MNKLQLFRIQKNYCTKWLGGIASEINEMGYIVRNYTDNPNWQFYYAIQGDCYIFYSRSDKLSTYIKLRFSNLIWNVIYENEIGF
jgi:hypothetical protein